MKKLAISVYRPSMSRGRFILMTSCLLVTVFFALHKNGFLSTSNPLKRLVLNDIGYLTYEIRFKNFRQEYRMNFTDPCPSSIKLLILSLTRRDGFEKRKGIRQTWMADAYHKETIRFLMADAQKNEKPIVSEKLEEEQAKYGDLIFIHGFEDIYQNLTLKVYAGFQWQQSYCPGAEWVLKADDDTVVDLRRLDYWIGHKFEQLVVQHNLAIMGEVLNGSKPVRNKNSKWLVTKEAYPADEYPPYTNGPAYLTTSRTVAALLRHTEECGEFDMEDVLFTGVVAERANVTRLHLPQHFNWYKGVRTKNSKIKINPCEDSVPSAISIRNIGNLKEFQEQYEKMKALKCLKKLISDLIN